MLRWLIYGTVFLASMLSGAKSTSGQEPKPQAPPAVPAEIEAWLAKWPEGDEQRDVARATLRHWALRQLAQSQDAKADFRMAITTTSDGEVIEELNVTTPHHGTARGFVLTPADHVGRGPALIYLAASPYQGDSKHAQPAEPERKAVQPFLQYGYVVMVVYPSSRDAAGDESADREAVDWPQTTRADFWLTRYFFARRDVDPERIAVFGVGSAARRAWWLAALESRVAAVVSFGGLEGQDRRPRIAGKHETTALLRLMAPRPHWLALEQRPADNSHDWVSSQRAAYRLDDLESLFQTSWTPREQWAPGSQAWREACGWLRDEL